MDADAPEPLVDARSARFELAAITVILLGGYVFGIVWVIPALAVVLAAGLGFGRRANLFDWIFRVVISDRLRPSQTATEPAGAFRFSELFAVVMLSVATLMFVTGLKLLIWPVALAEAGISALHATTGLSVEAAVRDRIRGARGR
jgi:hypothetical protein